MKRSINLLMTVWFTSLFFGCHTDESFNETASEISSPIEIEIKAYGGNKGSTLDRRLFMNVAKVGDIELSNVHALIDTGSPWLVLKGENFLPKEVLNENGVFFSGEQMMVNGIRLTKYKVVAAYGYGTSGARFHGVIGYAPVRIGPAGGNQITTQEMPAVVWYKKEGGGDSLIQNIMGLNIQSLGQQNDGTSGNITYYMNFGSNVKQGFRLEKVGSNFPQGTSIEDGVTQKITFGINSEIETGYSFVNMDVTAPYQANPYISCTVQVGSNPPLTSNVMVDSGNSSMDIMVASPNFETENGGKNVKSGLEVKYVIGDGAYHYRYPNDSTNGFFYTGVQPVPANPVNGVMNSALGLGFFIDYGIIYDYTNYRVGYKK